jgi:hypothetical protein
VKLCRKTFAIIVVLLAMGCCCALGEERSWTNDVERSWTNDVERSWTNDVRAVQTPELGDSSIATTALVGFAGLALTGAVVAHKKARSNAQ